MVVDSSVGNYNWVAALGYRVAVRHGMVDVMVRQGIVAGEIVRQGIVACEIVRQDIVIVNYSLFCPSSYPSDGVTVMLRRGS